MLSEEEPAECMPLQTETENSAGDLRQKRDLGALEKENTPELLDDVSTETLSGALPEILKIIDLLPAVTDMQEMMSIVGCVSRVRDIGLPGKATRRVSDLHRIQEEG